MVGSFLLVTMNKASLICWKRMGFLFCHLFVKTSVIKNIVLKMIFSGISTVNTIRFYTKKLLKRKKGKGYIMNSKRWIALIAAVVLFVFSIGFRFTMEIASTFMNDLFDFEEDFIEETLVEDGDMNNRIATLSLNGEIMPTEASPFLAEDGFNEGALLEQIEKAGEDDTIKAILFQVDSPGGDVGITAHIHRKIVEMQEEFDKPIYVTMGSSAASGGYYVSAPADKIFAESSTLTGSIGVIMQSINFSGLLDKYGVDFTTIKSAKHKDIMSPAREMTEEEEDIMQSMVDEMYDEFIDVVVDGRDMDEGTVRELADGRVYTGNQAEENGLVDEVGNYEDALDALKEDHDLEDAAVVEYGGDMDFLTTFGASVKGFLNKDKLNFQSIQEMIRESDQPRAMYK